jgi:hypothetical protein
VSSDYFMVSMRGGDDRPLFCLPSRSVEQVRVLYPEALAVVAISKKDFMELCERQERK